MIQKRSHHKFRRICMKLKNAFIFAFVCSGLLVFTQAINAQQPSTELSRAIPQIEEKLSANDIKQRISVLDLLVVYERDYDVTKTVLPYNLSAEDYAFVIRKIFEKDLTQADEKIARQALSKIEFLIIKFKLREFAKNLVEYIPKYLPNGMDFSRAGIQFGILGALKALQAKEYAPQIAALLQPYNKVLYREVLSTLVELRAKEALPALLSALYDKNYLERFSALEKLVKINGREAAPHIAKLLEDEHPNNRYWALDALVKLNAGEQSDKIWKLVNTGQTLQTEVYALAALAYFGDAEALQLTAKFIVENGERSAVLTHLVELKAKIIIPYLIKILEEEYLSNTAGYKTRTDIVYALQKLDAKESAGVLRKYLKRNKPSGAVVQVLGDFGDKEAVDDLLAIFNENLPYPADRITNNTFDSAEAAVALAKIGDKKTLKSLIDAAENPHYPYRSQIIIELNKHLDSELWKKAQGKVFPDSRQTRMVSIKELAEAYSQETKIPIIVHFEPGKDVAKRLPTISPYKETGLPWTSLGYNISLLDGLREIPRTISDGTLPQSFTFIFDEGRIHVLSVEKAVDWWRKNILTTK